MLTLLTEEEHVYHLNSVLDMVPKTQNHVSSKESSEHLNDTSPEVLFIERQMNHCNVLDQLVGVSNNHDTWVSKKRRVRKLTVAVWIDRWREWLNPDSR